MASVLRSSPKISGPTLPVLAMMRNCRYRPHMLALGGRPSASPLAWSGSTTISDPLSRIARVNGTTSTTLGPPRSTRGGRNHHRWTLQPSLAASRSAQIELDDITRRQHRAMLSRRQSAGSRDLDRSRPDAAHDGDHDRSPLGQGAHDAAAVVPQFSLANHLNHDRRVALPAARRGLPGRDGLRVWLARTLAHRAAGARRALRAPAVPALREAPPGSRTFAPFRAIAAPSPGVNSAEIWAPQTVISTQLRFRAL